MYQNIFLFMYGAYSTVFLLKLQVNEKCAGKQNGDNKADARVEKILDMLFAPPTKKDVCTWFYWINYICAFWNRFVMNHLIWFVIEAILWIHHMFKSSNHRFINVILARFPTFTICMYTYLSTSHTIRLHTCIHTCIPSKIRICNTSFFNCRSHQTYGLLCCIVLFLHYKHLCRLLAYVLVISFVGDRFLATPFHKR